MVPMSTLANTESTARRGRTLRAIVTVAGIALLASPALATAAESSSLYWSLFPALNRPQLQLEAAPQAPQGEIVEKIEVSGNVLMETDTILFFSATRAGAPFDWATAQQDFRTMLNSGYFDNIVMSWRRGEEGVVITIEVKETALLKAVRIQGTAKVDTDALVERMEQLEMPVEFEKPVDKLLMRRAMDVLETMLQGEEGLQFVQIDFELETPDGFAEGTYVDAVYNVVEGDEVRIENVYFEGATQFTQQELRWLAKRTGEHWLMSFITKNDRFSWAGYEIDMQTLSQEYRRLGYLDVQIASDPVVEVYEIDSPLPILGGKRRRLFVTIPINEGTQYRLGEIHVEGNKRFTDEQLAQLVPIEPGDVFDVKGIIDARDAMQSIYNNIGYFQILITPRPDANPDEGIADIIFEVNENALYNVRRIEFEGNTNTRDYVLRRNLRLHETGRWSQGLLDASKFKIHQLGYFQNVEEEVTIVSDPTTPRLAPGQSLIPGGEQAADEQDQGEQDQGEQDQGEQESGELDVKIKVTEVGRNQISFGGGVSALEGGFVQLGYTTRNLFGRGQTLSFFGQFGGRRTNSRISFAQPYLFDRRIRFGVDFFRDSLDFFDFQRRGQGFSGRLGFPLDRGEFTTFFIEYNYEFIDIGDVSTSFFGLSDPIFRALFLEEGKRTTSSLRPFLVYNTVDNPFNPSRGKRMVGSFEIAGGPLGGSLDFWKGQFNNTWYIPTKVEGRGVGAMVRQVFAFNVELRVVEPYGGLVEVPIFERFFLGGSNSVRGTRLRAIGPTDQFGNIIGGTRALQYNLEYIFQVAGPVRIAGFHDGGAAWDDRFALPLEELRKTAGVEFRVFMPVFNVPFRFFWAYNFDPLLRFGEERSTFEFAIGTTF